MKFSKFEYTSFPHKIFFGKDSFSNIRALLSDYNKVFVIAQSRVQQYVDELKSMLGEEHIFHFDQVVQHVPSHLVDQAKKIQSEENTDVLVAIGGGSAIGLAKALAIDLRQDIIAVPTTYAGSEMTNIWGITTKNGKTTGRALIVLPKYVIYDPVFTASMPVSLAATSAMNAMAHLIEAVYAHDTNPITYQNSLLAIKQLAKGMKIIAVQKVLSQEANQLLQLGAFIAGKSLCEVSMSLHHKAVHILGGSFRIDHASAHTVLQAYVLDYQWDALSESTQTDLVNAFDHDYPPIALQQLAKAMDAPYTLKEIGFAKQDIEQAVNLMLSRPYPNPKTLSKKGLTEMLTKAFTGILDVV